jgi:hypothetical protein
VLKIEIRDFTNTVMATCLPGLRFAIDKAKNLLGDKSG